MPRTPGRFSLRVDRLTTVGLLLLATGCVPSAAEPGIPLEPYVVDVPGTESGIEMLPIPGGRFRMGCPAEEPGSGPGESPAHEVEVSPFWMAEMETTWDIYESYQLDRVPDPDGVTGPTPPYMPMDFGMGVEGYPAIAMTHYAARQFCKWLSLQTGDFYRLPTEAEWEFACRAGSETAWSFGDDPALLDAHAWHYGNADDGYRQVGRLAANAFGLHDMHGNVAEWVADGFDPDAWAARAARGEVVVDPVVWPDGEWGRVVRGGSWYDDPEQTRSAARRASGEGWKASDPQRPQSIWYLTDADWVGFRVVRPLRPPPREEWARWWDADVPAIAEIQARQAAGGR